MVFYGNEIRANFISEDSTKMTKNKVFFGDQESQLFARGDC